VDRDGAGAAIRNCIFTCNMATYNGAAMLIQNGAAPAIANCAFSDNYCSGSGSAGSGAGAYVSGASPTFDRCLSDPQFATAPAGTWASVGAFNAATRQTTLTASGSPGWTPGAYAGLTVNPDTGQYLQFVIASNGADTITVWGDAAQVAAATENFQIYDYHIGDSSPCKDSGTGVGAPTDDIEGTARPQGAGYDMGAYEYAAALTVTIGPENRHQVQVRPPAAARSASKSPPGTAPRAAAAGRARGCHGLERRVEDGNERNAVFFDDVDGADLKAPELVGPVDQPQLKAFALLHRVTEQAELNPAEARSLVVETELQPTQAVSGVVAQGHLQAGHFLRPVLLKGGKLDAGHLLAAVVQGGDLHAADPASPIEPAGLNALEAAGGTVNGAQVKAVHIVVLAGNQAQAQAPDVGLRGKQLHRGVNGQLQGRPAGSLGEQGAGHQQGCRQMHAATLHGI
jgi:hypothetical protein